MRAERVPPQVEPDVALTLSRDEAETLLHQAYRTLPGGSQLTKDLMETLSVALDITPMNARRAIL